MAACSGSRSEVSMSENAGVVPDIAGGGGRVGMRLDEEASASHAAFSCSNLCLG